MASRLCCIDIVVNIALTRDRLTLIRLHDDIESKHITTPALGPPLESYDGPYSPNTPSLLDPQAILRSSHPSRG